jgi:hypothetical protein
MKRTREEDGELSSLFEDREEKRPRLDVFSKAEGMINEWMCINALEARKKEIEGELGRYR